MCRGSISCEVLKKKKLFPLGLEPRTFRVLGGCDNHYTTETHRILLKRQEAAYSHDSHDKEW
jgi:hypothetical protein